MRTILQATPAEAPGLDPGLAALGGVLLTIIATLVGAWIQSRREHRVWLRDRRLEAYADLNRMHQDGDHLKAEQRRVASSETATPQQAQAVLEQLERWEEGVSAAAARVNILGPDEVIASSDRLLGLWDTPGFPDAEAELAREMRKVLGIKARSWRGRIRGNARRPGPSRSAP